VIVVAQALAKGGGGQNSMDAPFYRPAYPPCRDFFIQQKENQNADFLDYGQLCDCCATHGNASIKRILINGLQGKI
jgi:hypothetical protein